MLRSVGMFLSGEEANGHRTLAHKRTLTEVLERLLENWIDLTV